MGTTLTDSLIRPKRIVDHIGSTKKTILYFLLLAILFVFPNLVYVITTGGIDKSDINYLVEMISSAESIPYKIDNNELVYTGDGESQTIIVNSKSSEIAVMFTNATRNNLKNAFSTAIKDKTSISSPIIVIFSKEEISIGFGVSRGAFSNLKTLMNYQKTDVNQLDFEKIKNIDEQNLLGKIFLSIVDEYKTELTIFLVPSLIIGGIINLFILLLIPSLICFIFNKSLNIKLGTIIKMAIYAFTPFVIATLISLGDTSSILAMIFEFISLIYLFISISSYYIQKNGGENEL